MSVVRSTHRSPPTGGRGRDGRAHARACLAALALGWLVGCDKAKALPAAAGIVSLTPVEVTTTDPRTEARVGGPTIGAIKLATPIYEKPDRRSAKLGYLRAGGLVTRAEKPASHDACPEGWYQVAPRGFLCAGEDASTDPAHPLLRALTRRPDLSRPLPYSYAFVRAVAPLYYRSPTKKEQLQYEFKLKEHLRSFRRLGEKWNAVGVGANDVPLDAEGNAIGPPPAEPPARSENELFGGDGHDEVPWFFQGKRRIPNISPWRTQDFAVITNRVARHAGLALIGSFQGDERRMAITTDARLVPASKLKPNVGSTWHGVDLRKQGVELPLAFTTRAAARYDLSRLRFDKTGELPRQRLVDLNGSVKHVGKRRMVQSKAGDWLDSDDLAIVAKPSQLPSFATGSQKWIDISIFAQTLVLYEGNRPVYATMVSTGRDGLGDPKKTHSTVRGTFRVREKHVTTTMDAHEVDNKFELRDVPWVQYFEGGYALHATYWHDDYGKPRSHGCVNLSPIDARRVFLWTDPPLPTGWHGVNAGEANGTGTLVHIHP